MNDIQQKPRQLQGFFETHQTKSFEFRKQQLLKLKNALYKYEEELYEALSIDLKKNKEESWITEIGFTITEINNALKNLKKWMKPKRVSTNLLNFPSSSYILSEPLGVVLIIGPWNYPVQLLLNPLVGAIAAGNCILLKPSEFAPATSALIKKITDEIFNNSYIVTVEGSGPDIIPQLMNNYRFDHVFYTGSTEVGRSIYELAAKKLVPVTLELGGKSPCIIEKDANIKVAAKRIAVTKFSNAGQMCVAPDYLLVHKNIENEFLKQLKKYIHNFYMAEEVRDYHYGKIINEKHFSRLDGYLKNSNIAFGGIVDEEKMHIQPTILSEVGMDDPVMQEEIFGPLLPVITWDKDEEVYNCINRNKDPLSFYVFTEDKKKADQWIKTISFGGGCINNASWHLTNYNLPFGGRGYSGIGNYHGKFSFDTFSHKKAVMRTPTWFDPGIKYPPYEGKLNLFKKMIR
jgi:aldehyde dehydrogenase (NAD+)